MTGLGRLPMPLTDTEIKKAKPGIKPAKLSDEKDLYLLVNPTGSKLWLLSPTLN